MALKFSVQESEPDFAVFGTNLSDHFSGINTRDNERVDTNYLAPFQVTPSLASSGAPDPSELGQATANIGQPLSDDSVYKVSGDFGIRVRHEHSKHKSNYNAAETELKQNYNAGQQSGQLNLCSESGTSDQCDDTEQRRKEGLSDHSGLVDLRSDYMPPSSSPSNSTETQTNHRNHSNAANIDTGLMNDASVSSDPVCGSSVSTTAQPTSPEHSDQAVPQSGQAVPQSGKAVPQSGPDGQNKTRTSDKQDEDVKSADVTKQGGVGPKPSTGGVGTRSSTGGVGTRSSIGEPRDERLASSDEGTKTQRFDRGARSREEGERSCEEEKRSHDRETKNEGGSSGKQKGSRDSSESKGSRGTDNIRIESQGMFGPKVITIQGLHHLGPNIQFGDHNHMTINGTTTTLPPNFTMPTFTMPTFNMPTFNVPTFNVPQSSSHIQMREAAGTTKPSSQGANAYTAPPASKPKQRITVRPGPVDSVVLQTVADNLHRDWQRVGRRLGLTDPQLSILYSDFQAHGGVEVAYQMLRTWKDQNGDQATILRLATVLAESRRGDIAKLLSVDVMRI